MCRQRTRILPQGDGGQHDKTIQSLPGMTAVTEQETRPGYRHARRATDAATEADGQAAPAADVLSVHGWEKETAI